MNIPERRRQASIARCYAILANANVQPRGPVKHKDVARGREIGAAIVMAAQCHPTLGEALRRGAGYSWNV